jgi:hypothetical protein
MAFCQSFATPEEKAQWTRPFLEAGEYGHRIRHELYEHVVFPALLAGYENNDFWSTVWLARTTQNVYAAKALHEKIGYATQTALLRRCHELDPSNEAVRNELLDQQLAWFAYCIHEWPAGVLYGHDGATVEQCREILEEIAYTRSLDVKSRHKDLLDDVEAKTREYMNRC